jgi:hypothetical protein
VTIDKDVVMRIEKKITIVMKEKIRQCCPVGLVLVLRFGLRRMTT